MQELISSKERYNSIAHKIDKTTSEAVLKDGKIKSKAEKADDGSIIVDKQDTER